MRLRSYCSLASRACPGYVGLVVRLERLSTFKDYYKRRNLLGEGVGKTIVGATALTARTTLHSLRACGCEYRPRSEDGTWIARCPVCRCAGALKVWETREWEPDDERVPGVMVLCRSGCSHSELVRVLSGDPVVLEAREESRVWRARYWWAVDQVRRMVAS